ncbi:thymidine kinase [Candidatus Uhrbacteria bacterium]|nr:thymidine kinase [Candidatus Uhrbacteria bacterium]
MGTIEVIAGCMFSGKSEELIRRLRRLAVAKKKIIVFKPAMDNRWNRRNELVSRSGTAFAAYPVLTPLEMLDKSVEYDVVGIDEAHFFDQTFLSVISDLRASGKQVIVAGLDMDFRAEPFEHVATLLAIADEVIKLDAVCMSCGGRATLTQRLIQGAPAQRNAERLVVGDEEYEARCRACHLAD